MKLTVFRFLTSWELSSFCCARAVLLKTSDLMPVESRSEAPEPPGRTIPSYPSMIEKQQGYTSIGIPIGLIQVFKNREIFDPSDPNFDPVRAVEYAADPMHLTINRDSNPQQNLFITNLIDAGLNINRDLNTYRGFKPAQHISAQGLIAPSWGKTIRVGEVPAETPTESMWGRDPIWLSERNWTLIRGWWICSQVRRTSTTPIRPTS